MEIIILEIRELPTFLSILEIRETSIPLSIYILLPFFSPRVRNVECLVPANFNFFTKKKHHFIQSDFMEIQNIAGTVAKRTTEHSDADNFFISPCKKNYLLQFILF